MKKKIVGLILSVCMLMPCTFSVNAAQNNASSNTEASLDYDEQQVDQEDGQSPMLRSSQSKSYKIPGDKGTLTSNAWRTTGNGTESGNTLQWDYQVSAVYAGSKSVESIRTTWKGQASLRSSATFNLGVNQSGVVAGAGSSWQTVTTPEKYWENDNGSKESSVRSNMVISPKKDYRADTISIINTARVYLKGDAKPYTITAGA